MTNVYTAKSDETLEAVGFYATAPDTEYEVYVFDGDSFREHVENNEKFQTDSGKVLASGVLTDTGFYTVSLEKPWILDAGEIFAAVSYTHLQNTACFAVLHFFQMDSVADHVVKLILDRQAAEGPDRFNKLCMAVNIGISVILILFHLCGDHADHPDDA